MYAVLSAHCRSCPVVRRPAIRAAQPYPSGSDRAGVYMAEFARVLHYEIVPFTAVDAAARAIYHTNVVMSLGTHFAALATRAIADDAERRTVVARIESSNRELIDLRNEELECFAGNLLELTGSAGPVIALSAAALQSLAAPTRRTLERYGEIVSADIATIERIGGGSVRCMLAEVSLPPRLQFDGA